MFTRRPYIPYTPEQISDYITKLEILTRLQEKALQNHRLLKDDHYNQAYEGYTRNIDSAQRCLDHMLKANTGAK